MTDYASLTEALSLLGDVTLRDAVAYSEGPPIIPAVTATTPTETQATALLAAVVAEIDMHLRGQGYETPATDTEALASLKTICMNGTAAKIAKAKWPADTGPGGDRGLASLLRDDYAAGLAFIDAGGLAPDSDLEDTGSSFSHGMPSTWPPDEAPY